jgi:oxepin-CoA hydrolase/3-oxo-5,6-dehydrosuberyl-CoA semialdehyde dehydrogenase
MLQTESYACGQWLFAGGEKILQHAIDGKPFAKVATQAPPVAEMWHYARSRGGLALRELTFHDRARRLKALALYLMERKEKYYEVSWATGATKNDSWIDIEGGIGTLFVYASKGRRELPDKQMFVDGNYENLSKNFSFGGIHVCVPKEGVAVHINAFNFPIWGMLEKIGANLLAGVPAIVKPATNTCYLTEVLFRDIIASGIFPEGSLQLISGPVGDLLAKLDEQDVVTFTGSAETALKLRAHPNILARSIPFNAEADSLNFCLLGRDVTPDMEEYQLFIKEVVREVTAKSGQKCTAIRRVLVPDNMIEQVGKDLAARLQSTTVGDPRREGVRMGALAGHDQVKDVAAKLQLLRQHCRVLLDGAARTDFNSADAKAGAFMAPTLLLANQDASAPHDIEAFGPITTMIGYKDHEHAHQLIRRGRGSLVGSIVTADNHLARQHVFAAGAYHGRLLILNRDCAKESTGHGSPMPQLVHGGPGRAGGGEELGGMRAVKHYMQRVALQGSPTTLTAITDVYIPKAKQTEDRIHPFRKYFEELQIGETYTTAKRTVTEADIVNFSNVSWDHFYAHTDATSLEGSLFEKRVAHGYFLIAAAAGLFVDPKKGPVLANYGLDELRFIKPVYAGTTIGVRLTVKEKTAQEMRPGDTVRKGIVKWYVDIYDDSGESVALATILTLVQAHEPADFG